MAAPDTKPAENGTTAKKDDVLLCYEDVNLAFDNVLALDHVSFEMCAGETRVILGAAGSGKTTLLKTAIGLVKPDSGRIYLFGEDIVPMREEQLFDLRRRVGVLFQEGGLFDSLKISENVGYPLVNGRDRVIDWPSVDKRVVDALRFVELEKTVNKFPSELSGGMRRRVGIARAVVTNPPLVLYDSPTAGLDPITANTIMALIAKERDAENTASLIVTHRYQDGQLMAQFRYNPESGTLESASHNGAGGQHAGPASKPTIFMVMNQGRIVFEGSQEELEASKDDYISKFVLRQ